MISVIVAIKQELLLKQRNPISKSVYSFTQVFFANNSKCAVSSRLHLLAITILISGKISENKHGRITVELYL